MIETTNEFLWSVLENVSDGVVACDENGILTYFNTGLKELHGLPVEPLAASEWAMHYNLFNEDGSAMSKEDIPLFRALRGEQVIEAPVVIKRKDGSVKYALSSGGSLRNKEGNILGAMVTMKDVTDSVNNKIALDKQNEELRKTNEELDRFVYSTSHELRSPLASILGLVGLAKADESNPEKLQLLKLIENSVERLDRFIEDINDYSRNSRLDLVNEEINFEELIIESIDQLNYMEYANKVALNRDIYIESPFYGNKIRIKMLLNNFISNAVKYRNSDLTDSFVHFKIHQELDNVTIKIKDNGSGIHADHLDHIFKMFYRASSTKTGTGLGLFIVKETIEKMGGSISVKSVPLEGTAFKIIIPNTLP